MGRAWRDAVPFPGVIDFFNAARRRGRELFIVSHKTRFANFAETKVDLREAALGWMEAQGFFDPVRIGLARGRVFFADTRAEKIARIAALDCSVFIDDLEEVFADPGFPGHIARVLFTPGDARSGDGVMRAHETWAAIIHHVLGEAATTPPGLPDVAAIAARLAGLSVRAATPVRTGGNNRLFKISASDGTHFALKAYPRQASDHRDRLATEFKALDFLRSSGIKQVPHPLACDPSSGCALYEWIEGEPPSADRAAIDAALALADRLRELSRHHGAAAMPAASEACLSAAMIVEQIERRLAALRAVAPSYHDLEAFLERQFAPVAARAIRNARAALCAPDFDFDAALEGPRRCLSPSDFGFHNALALRDGRIVFLDFEYFGWDDPVKLTSDFMLHPGMNLPADLARYFRAGATDLFGAERDFELRLNASLPLYALRWTMILLNEFLPDRWTRKVLAGFEGERTEALTRQLGKARAMIARLAAGEAIRQRPVAVSAHRQDSSQ